MEASLLNSKDSTSQDIQRDFYRIQLSSERTRFVDDWLTVNHSITFYHQLDAQTSCLFTFNTLIKILYIFRAYSPGYEQGMLETCRGF